MPTNHKQLCVPPKTHLLNLTQPQNFANITKIQYVQNNGPFVLIIFLPQRKDRNQPGLHRSELNSRNVLMVEQTNP